MNDRRQVQRGELEPDQEQLLAGLLAQGIEGRGVLDIGCGMGHLHHRLLDEGAASVVGVEFNSDYLEEARVLARTLGHEDRVTYLEGDFTKLTGEIEPADVTILDKVVHCYQEPERLVRLSAFHTRSVYALTFPRDRWRMRLIIRCGGAVLPLLRMGWRPCFSPPEDIRSWVREAGFERVCHDETRQWHTEVYVRGEAAADLPIMAPPDPLAR